jgi:uncharacterized protein
VLFTAAHNPRGKSAFLFDPAGARHWELISSDYAIEEARRNIVSKFPHCAARLVELTNALTVVSQPNGESIPIALPAKDRPIFLAACAGRATHLLTGDLRDFGPHMNLPGKTSGIVIQTVADFLEGL